MYMHHVPFIHHVCTFSRQERCWKGIARFLCVYLLTFSYFQLGVAPLPDNHKVDKYFYQITVFTGNRKNAGTKSKVRLTVFCASLICHVFGRFILLLEATTMIRVFAPLVIFIERFCNVAELIHLSWLFQSR
jgi:hypothetical protein